MTNFEEGAVLVSGLILPTTTNTPTRAGEQLNTISEIYDIPNPHVGMIVYVKDEDCFYYIKSLKDKEVSGITIPNALVDEYCLIEQFVDAKPDDKIYARKNNEWVELTDAPSDNKQYEILNLIVSSNDGLNIVVDVDINGTIVSISSEYGHSVKFEYGTKYTIIPQAVEGYVTPEPLTFVAGQEIRTVTLSYMVILITTIRIDQNISDSATMITRIVDLGGIEAIRANSHRYLGKKDENGVLNVRQLNDINSNFYADNTLADLSGTDGDVFMKLPKFYYKSEQFIVEGVNNDNIYDISFAYGFKPSDDWKEWDGKVFIGAFLSSWAYRMNSCVDTSIINNRTYVDYENVNSDEYDFMRWDTITILSYLFYTYYGTTDYLSTIGESTSYGNSRVTGKTSQLGMYDSTPNTMIDNKDTNFWGLENYDQITFVDTKFARAINDGWVNNQPVIVTNHDGSTTEFIYNTGYVSKIDLANFSIIPTERGSSAWLNYCRHDWTYGEYGSDKEHVMTHKSIADIAFYEKDSDTAVCRITYHGDYIEI